MKKYVKPELFYESFELSQHIAGCNLTINTADAFGEKAATDILSCTASGYVEGIHSTSWFMEANGSCSPVMEVYCYTNGSITSATVNS